MVFNAQKYKSNRRYKATSLQSLTKPLLSRAIGKSAPALLTLLQSWSQIAPQEFLETTRAVKIRFPDRNLTRNGVLDLDVLPEAAFIIQHSLPKLIHAINLYFGYPAIARVNIRQISFVIKTIQDQNAYALKQDAKPLEGIKDPALAQSLANLAELVKKRRAKEG